MSERAPSNWQENELFFESQFPPDAAREAAVLAASEDNVLLGAVEATIHKVGGIDKVAKDKVIDFIAEDYQISIDDACRAFGMALIRRTQEIQLRGQGYGEA